MKKALAETDRPNIQQEEPQSQNDDSDAPSVVLLAPVKPKNRCGSFNRERKVRVQEADVSKAAAPDEASSSRQSESNNNSRTNIGTNSNQGSPGGGNDASVDCVIEDHLEGATLQETKLEHERRMQGKKRKRLEMRLGKHEVTQQPNTNRKGGEPLIPPGRLVTLDFALQFSNVPR